MASRMLPGLSLLAAAAAAAAAAGADAKLRGPSESAKAPLPAPLQGVLAELRSREQNASRSLRLLEEEEKKAQASLKVTGTKKEQSMIKRLKSQEHRRYAKVRAVKQAALRELRDAEQSIEERDVPRLQSILAHMESETKSLEAKSGAFLY
mmetsp:Transcript_84450/g.262191  ORF Transcript_84450/g.262191 Transcript_84450/m.262191 type:complete len:151 (+) Transcript_84450:2-454(+)